MQVDINGKTVPVQSHHADETVEMAVRSRVFREWAEGLDPRFGVTSIVVQDVDFKGEQSVDTVMFVKVAARATKPFDEIVMLRGGTVGMLLVLNCEGVRHTMLVRQQRIATGDFELVELPAGMIDGGTFRGAAILEIEQELGIRISEDEIIDLTDMLPGKGGIHLSPGLLDEQVRLIAVERDVTRGELAELQGKATGLREEGESITVLVMPLSDLPYSTRDAKAFVALRLYEIYAGLASVAASIE